MLWFIYNVLFAVGYTLMMPRFLLRMWRRGGYRRGFLQRFAVYSPEIIQRLNERRRIWIHAVSVGEIQVAFRFMEELRSRNPENAFVVTTTTSTGHAIAEKKLLARDVLLYFPSDFPVIVNRALDLIKPRALILTESELWPNLVRHAGKRGIPVILINGRISDSSYKGYKLLSAFFGRILRSIDLFLVQSRVEGKYLLEFGVDAARIKVMGSAKYDVAGFDPSVELKARELLEMAGMGKDDFIVTGGSTWPGEEKALLDILKTLKPAFPNLKLVLVPRHAERRAEVEKEIENSGFAFLRRSILTKETSGKTPVDVLLVDTTGELMSFYACADVVFVGKSLTSHGGQNVIEPALLAKPIVTGPNMENFADVVAEFLDAKALIQVRNSAGLEKAIESLLRNREMRDEYGRRAAKFVKDKQGVVRKSADLISEVLPAL